MLSYEIPRNENDAPNDLSKEVQSYWEIPAMAQYISLFRVAFNLPRIEIEELEEGLVDDSLNGPNPWLKNLVISFLKSILPKTVNESNWEHQLRKLIRRNWPKGLYAKKEFPFDEDKAFNMLPLRSKVEILYSLCLIRLDKSDTPELIKEYDAEALRIQSLGSDDAGNKYYYFYGTRLYKEQVIEGNKYFYQEHMNDSFKKKRGRGRPRKIPIANGEWYPKQMNEPFKEKRGRGRPRKIPLSNGESFLDTSNKNECINISDQASWSVVCDTLEDWISLAEKYKYSESEVEQNLFQILQHSFLPNLQEFYDEKEFVLRQRMKGRMQPIHEKIVTRRETRRLHGIENNVDYAALNGYSSEEEFKTSLVKDVPMDRGQCLKERNKESNEANDAQILSSCKKQMSEKEIEKSEEVARKLFGATHESDKGIEGFSRDTGESGDESVSGSEESSVIEVSVSVSEESDDYFEELDKDVEKSYNAIEEPGIPLKETDKIEESSIALKETDKIEESGRGIDESDKDIEESDKDIIIESDKDIEESDTGIEVIDEFFTVRGFRGIADVKKEVEDVDKSIEDSNKDVADSEKDIEELATGIEQAESPVVELPGKEVEQFVLEAKKILTKIKSNKDALPFLHPVDVDDAPDYYKIIKDPVDLSMIERRLRDGEYETLHHLDADIRKMVSNCKLYNGAHHSYSKMADNLKIVFQNEISALLDHFDDIQKNIKQKAADNRQSSDSERCSDSHHRSSSSACLPSPPRHPSSTPNLIPTLLATYMKQLERKKKQNMEKFKNIRDLKGDFKAGQGGFVTSTPISPEKATASNEKSAIYHGPSMNMSSASPVKRAVNKTTRVPAVSVRNSFSHITSTTPKKSRKRKSKNKKLRLPHENVFTNSLNNSSRKNKNISGTDRKKRSKNKNHLPSVVNEAKSSLNNSSGRKKCNRLQQNICQSCNSKTVPVVSTGYNPGGSQQNVHLPAGSSGQQVPMKKVELPSASPIPVVYIPITGLSQQNQFNNGGVPLASPSQPLMYVPIQTGMNQAPVQPIQMAGNVHYLVSSPQNTTGFLTKDQNTLVQNNVGQLSQGCVPSAVMQLPGNGLQGFQFSTISQSNVQTFTQVPQGLQFVNIPCMQANQSISSQQTIMNFQSYQFDPSTGQ